uniref:exodeoxyribonuclease III n=1 Tax=Sphenodon punctatus TaxID=8508 RepID=A0A8D0H3E1_SPHPU
MTQVPRISFVFLDSETTGLSRPRVSELSLVAVHRCSLLQPPRDPDSGLPLPPRIVDKLTLCMTPQKPFEPAAEELTGLSNWSLQENGKPGFDQAVVQAIECFLARQAGPVCLVAHNGFGYDFPLLRAELDRLEADLPPATGCLDTLLALRELEKPCKRSYQLVELYKRYYGQGPELAHSAEGDVHTLLMVFLFRAPKLVEWAAYNARSWADILPLYPQSPRAGGGRGFRGPHNRLF